MPVIERATSMHCPLSTRKNMFRVCKIGMDRVKCIGLLHPMLRNVAVCSGMHHTHAATQASAPTDNDLQESNAAECSEMLRNVAVSAEPAAEGELFLGKLSAFSSGADGRRPIASSVRGSPILRPNRMRLYCFLPARCIIRRAPTP